MPTRDALRGLTPIAPRATTDLIADQVRALLAAGAYPQGSQITEAELAEALGVSRGPIREALQRLVQEGVLNSHRNRGLFVSRISRDDLIDIYRLREALEVSAMELVMNHEDSSFVRQARKLLSRMATLTSAKDIRRVTDVDFAFHELLINESRSPRLARAFSTLSLETRICLEALESAGSQSDNVALHTRIVDAIEARDLPAARAAMRAHNDSVLQDLRFSDEQEPQP